MKIFFTDTGGMRVLEECNLTEIKLKDRMATDGITDRPMYRIFNTPFGGQDKTTVIFGGEKEIGQSLRDAFWKDIANTFKHSIPVFDVDEWHGNIKFISPEEMDALEKKRKKKKK